MYLITTRFSGLYYLRGCGRFAGLSFSVNLDEDTAA